MILLKLPNGEKFEIRHQRATSEKDALVVENSEGERVASFTWNVFTGEIGAVRVEACVGEIGVWGTKDYIPGKNYQRMGIATALFQLANTYTKIKHSAYRTGAGDAWAHSVGGEIPPLNRN